MYKIITAAILLLTVIKVNSQISILAGAGMNQSFTGQLSVSYAYKNYTGAVDMVSMPFRARTYFGLTAGYQLQSNETTIRPYIGVYRTFVGNNRTQDRYIHDGTTTVLYDNQEVNRTVGAFGAVISRSWWYVDFGYLDGLKLMIGGRYTF